MTAPTGDQRGESGARVTPLDRFVSRRVLERHRDPAGRRVHLRGPQRAVRRAPHPRPVRRRGHQRHPAHAARRAVVPLDAQSRRGGRRGRDASSRSPASSRGECSDDINLQIDRLRKPRRRPPRRSSSQSGSGNVAGEFHLEERVTEAVNNLGQPTTERRRRRDVPRRTRRRDPDALPALVGTTHGKGAVAQISDDERRRTRIDVVAEAAVRSGRTYLLIALAQGFVVGLVTWVVCRAAMFPPRAPLGLIIGLFDRPAVPRDRRRLDPSAPARGRIPFLHRGGRPARGLPRHAGRPGHAVAAAAGSGSSTWVPR